MKKTFASFVLAVMACTTAAAAQFRLPAFETTRLPNGLTVVLMERHEVPLIAVRAVVRAGAVNDGPKSGLAALASDALLLGSSAHTKAAIDEAFDMRGARIAAAMGAERATTPPCCCRCSPTSCSAPASTRPNWRSCAPAS
jgi:predicted Zn-dependent peptidase